MCKEVPPSPLQETRRSRRGAGEKTSFKKVFPRLLLCKQTGTCRRAALSACARLSCRIVSPTTRPGQGLWRVSRNNGPIDARRSVNPRGIEHGEPQGLQTHGGLPYSLPGTPAPPYPPRIFRFCEVLGRKEIAAIPKSALPGPPAVPNIHGQQRSRPFRGIGRSRLP